MGGYFSRVKEVREKHRSCLRCAFLSVNILFVFLTFGMIIAGAKFTNLDLFHFNSMHLSWLQTDVVVGIIVFTLLFLAISCFGFYIVAR